VKSANLPKTTGTEQGPEQGNRGGVHPFAASAGERNGQQDVHQVNEGRKEGRR
jgi:hypothetical protein